MLRSLAAAVAYSSVYVAIGLANRERRRAFALTWAVLGGLPLGATAGAAAAGLVGVLLASSSSCRTEVCSAALAVLVMLGGAVGAVLGGLGCGYLAHRWHRDGERKRSATLYLTSGIVGFPAVCAAFHLLSESGWLPGVP
jgi:zinc transporter ZupT